MERDAYMTAVLSGPAVDYPTCTVSQAILALRGS
jgi:hypothetical protein